MINPTLTEIYTAINPLPAKLSVKGKVKPVVEVRVEANASISVQMKWQKPFCKSEWEHEYECFLGEDFGQALRKAVAFIKKMPSAEQAKLNNFMGKLGHLIDRGNQRASMLII